MSVNCFPVAVWYGGGKARAPMMETVARDSEQRWRMDIRNIANAGFNTIRTWIDWTTGEPKPGQFDFTALDLVMRLSKEAGLKVIVQIYLDAAPDWMDGMYPDAKYRSQSGHEVESQGSPGFCFDHPGVRSAAEKFLRALAEHVKEEPHFIGWDVWSEPHVTNWAYIDYLTPPVVFCYCHYTVQRFQDWLKNKYGTIEELNRVWYRSFPHFRAVNAPRFSTLQNYTEFIDWQLFLTEKIAGDLAWRAATIKSIDPHHAVASHAGSPSIINLPLLHNGEPDDWKMAESVDIWGVSIYPHHYVTGDPWDPALRAAAITDARSSSRSAGKEFWLGELQGGLGYVGLRASKEVRPEDVRLWGWEAIGEGAKGICYFAYYPMRCGFESNGFGLVRLNGVDTGRLAAAGSVAKAIQEHEALFQRSIPVKPRVAILYNVMSNIMWTCMRNTDPTIPRASNLGVFRALFERNIKSDYLHLNDIERGELSHYAVLYIPLGIMMTEQAAAAIKRFVNDGGTVIAEARTGWNNEHGWCGENGVPGFGLQDVFGCRENLTYAQDEVHLRMESGINEIRGTYWAQVLEPLVDQACIIGRFTDGRPAVVAHTYGRGKAILIGSLISAAYERHRDEATGAWLAGMIQDAGAEPIAKTADNKLLQVRALEMVDATKVDGGSERIIVMTNTAEHELDTEIALSSKALRLTVKGDRGGGWLVMDMLTGQKVEWRSRAEDIVLRHRFAGLEAWVVRLTASVTDI